MNKAKTVLVVDDEADIRTSVARLLSNRGYSVETASDGVEALERLKVQDPVHLLILDILMPRLAGLEVLGRIKQTPHHNTPVILLTAKSTIDDIATGYNKGADFYVTKPCDPRLLLNAVDYLIGELSVEEFSKVELELLTTEGVFFGLGTFSNR